MPPSRWWRPEWTPFAGIHLDVRHVTLQSASLALADSNVKVSPGAKPGVVVGEGVTVTMLWLSIWRFTQKFNLTRPSTSHKSANETAAN